MKETNQDGMPGTKSWHVCGNISGQGIILDDYDGRTIAATYETEDALLIAAAPDLLDACEALLRLLEMTSGNPYAVESQFGEETIRDAMDAVAKAKGE